MRCHDCDHGLDCCHAVSVEHADGTTECLGDDPCTLAHALHRWAVPCADVDCRCQLAADALPAAA
jgi:hypothetical protein